MIVLTILLAIFLSVYWVLDYVIYVAILLILNRFTALPGKIVHEVDYEDGNRKRCEEFEVVEDALKINIPNRLSIKTYNRQHSRDRYRRLNQNIISEYVQRYNSHK